MGERGFMIPPQIYVLLFVAVVAGGALLTYNYVVAKAERMEQERDAALAQAAQVTQQIFTEREQVAMERNARAEAEKEMALARERIVELEGLFSRHDLDDLLQKKPGLILSRSNAATERVFRDIEASAAD